VGIEPRVLPEMGVSSFHTPFEVPMEDHPSGTRISFRTHKETNYFYTYSVMCPDLFMKTCEVLRFLLTLKVRIMILSPDTVSVFPKKGFSDPPVRGRWNFLYPRVVQPTDFQIQCLTRAVSTSWNFLDPRTDQPTRFQIQCLSVFQYDSSKVNVLIFTVCLTFMVPKRY
jgi:hypothetical protein